MPYERKGKKVLYTKALYWTYYRILKRMSNISIPLDSGDFSVMTKRVVRLHPGHARAKSLYSGHSLMGRASGRPVWNMNATNGVPDRPNTP